MENQIAEEFKPKTRNCPSCHSEISAGITKCPYCGKHLVSWYKRNPLIATLLMFFIFSYVLSGVGSLFGTKQAGSIEVPEVTNINRQKEKTGWELADEILSEQKVRSVATQKEVASLIKADSHQEAKDLLIGRQKDIVAMMLEVRRNESLSESDKKRVLEPMAAEAEGLANEVKFIGEFQVDTDVDRLLRSLEDFWR